MRTYAGDLRTFFTCLLLPWDGESDVEKAADFSMRFGRIIPGSLGMAGSCCWSSGYQEFVRDGA